MLCVVRESGLRLRWGLCDIVIMLVEPLRSYVGRRADSDRPFNCALGDSGDGLCDVFVAFRIYQVFAAASWAVTAGWGVVSRPRGSISNGWPGPQPTAKNIIAVIRIIIIVHLMFCPFNKIFGSCLIERCDRIILTQTDRWSDWECKNQRLKCKIAVSALGRSFFM